MSMRGTAYLLCLVWSANVGAQIPKIKPPVLATARVDGKVTLVEVAAHFVTAIRMPETVNSVVVGDPALFQVEHSDREPELVFVKALTTQAAETNLVISTTGGREVCLLVVSRGEQKSEPPVDFLVKYKPARQFLIEPAGFPSSLVAQTVPLVPSPTVDRATPHPSDAPHEARHNGLDELLEQQERAPLPVLYGGHIGREHPESGRIRAGVSQVMDEGQAVIALFSVVNPTEHPILLMPPQVQLGGRTRSGKILRRSRWSNAEQLPVTDFRLSRRRLGPRERADGVVLFERPPYKQASETLFLEMAEAGAVDRPALAPMGFGISSLAEETKNGRRATKK